MDVARNLILWDFCTENYYLQIQIQIQTLQRVWSGVNRDRIGW